MKRLSIFGALFHALFNIDTRAFPNHEGKRLEPAEISKRIRDELKNVPQKAATQEGFIDLLSKAKESLVEAKSQTEYQDQKIARLLTIVAFLTAAAGTVFSKVVDAYPIERATPWEGWTIAVYAAYLLFFIFVALTSAGALVSFHAMRTRFVWDASQDSQIQGDREPRSQLFFQESVRVTPENWARPFSAVDENGRNSQLLMDSYKNYVIESYLVNAKIADKLRMLEPAQAVLSYAIRFLLVWFFAVAFLFLAVERPTKGPNSASEVAREMPDSALSLRARTSSAHVENHGPSVVVNCSQGATPTVPPATRSKTPQRRSCSNPEASTSANDTVGESKN